MAREKLSDVLADRDDLLEKLTAIRNQADEILSGYDDDENVSDEDDGGDEDSA